MDDSAAELATQVSPALLEILDHIVHTQLLSSCYRICMLVTPFGH